MDVFCIPPLFFAHVYYNDDFVYVSRLLRFDALQASKQASKTGEGRRRKKALFVSVFSQGSKSFGEIEIKLLEDERF